MYVSEKRWMRLLVFFDLPVLTKKERKAASEFRRFLIKDGYFMLQLSVYCRTCNGADMISKHRERLVKQLPENGSVRCLVITDKQYGTMDYLVGTETAQEKVEKTSQLVLF